MFQFHIGSIQRATPMRKRKLKVLFQFHIGSIQSLMIVAGCSPFEGFNSTLVRFKVRGPPAAQRHQSGVSIPHWFDSKGARSRAQGGGETAFQFHIGSIQSSTIASAWLGGYSSFNSTLVRFKGDNLRRGLWRNPSFNSTLVRFKGRNPMSNRSSSIKVSIPHWFDSKVERSAAHARAQRSFNSTLVRFKDNDFRALRHLVTPFQFHIGSIQSYAGTGNRVSINGSFNSTLVRFKVRAALVIFANVIRVSIPHWFDSKKRRLAVK